MARQVLPFVGLIVGSYFGAPQLGFMIGTLVGNAVDPQVVRGPRLGEAGLQTSAEGVFRPIVFGTAALKGNIIDRVNRVVRTEESGGKGGGPVVETDRVYWTFAIRLCEGPIGAVLRIWQDEKLVYDMRPGSSIPDESSEFAEGFRLYLGDEDQLPDPDLEAAHGVGNTPAYRGTAYIVFPNFDLTDYRERIPDFRFEVAMDAQTEEGSTDWDYVQQLGSDLTGAAFGLSNVLVVGTTGAHGPGQIWVGDANALAFTQIEPPIPGSYYDVAYGAGRYVISADGGYVLVTTGGPPTVVPTATSNARLVIVRTAERFVRMGFGGDVEWSEDGLAPWNVVPGGVGVNSDVRYGVVRGGLLFAFTSAGIRVSSDQGDTWEASPINSDPAPGQPWSGVAGDAGALRAYKNNSASSYTQYTYNGSSWDPVSITGVNASGYVGREIGVIDNRWVGSGVTDGAPEYPKLQSSDDGTPPFEFDQLNFGPGTTAEAKFIRIVDSFNGIGLAVGRQNDGVCFVFRNNYRSSGQAVGSPVSLASIVAALHQRAGHETWQYNVSELDDMVAGLVLQGDYTCADAIRTLMPVYFFDGAEFDAGSGYRVQYTKRGKPVVLTITEDDLIDAPEQTVRQDAFERPRAIHLHYESPSVGYAPAKATVTRDSTDVKVVGESSIQVPVSFEDVEEPRRIAHKLIKVLWTEVAGEEEFTVHDGFLGLVPGDCIGVSLRGQVRRMRITQEMIEPGQQRLRLIADRQSAYTSAITGIPLPEPTPPLPSIVGPTVFEFLDIPALIDTNDSLLYYVAASGQTEAWYGAVIQRSIPPDTSFANVAAFNRATVMGVLLDEVSEASEHYTDTTNAVRVQLYLDDALDSLSNEQFLSEGGAFALEKPDGTWELMQYRDAVDEGDRTFTLTHLLRGRLNSSPSEHEVGARFVLLSGVRTVDAVTAFIGRELVHRPVSMGASPDGTPQVSDTFTGQSQVEFPVAYVFLSRAGDVISARTVPRHRFGTEVVPVRSLNWIAFRWTATDGTNIATQDTTSETATFDVTGWSSPVTISVAQVNRFTGAGPSVSEQIA
jgi:hypothetical protein